MRCVCAPGPAPAWGAALKRAARARSKMWERELMDEEMDALLRAFEGTARVSCQHGMSIVSLICNVARTSEILEQARAPGRARAAARRWKSARGWPPHPRALAAAALCGAHMLLHKRAALEASRPGDARRAGAPAPRLLGPGRAAGAQVFRVLGREGVNVKMMSQGASKTNISLIVSDAEGQRVVRALHRQFFAPER